MAQPIAWGMLGEARLRVIRLLLFGPKMTFYTLYPWCIFNAFNHHKCSKNRRVVGDLISPPDLLKPYSAFGRFFSSVRSFRSYDPSTFFLCSVGVDSELVDHFYFQLVVSVITSGQVT